MDKLKIQLHSARLQQRVSLGEKPVLFVSRTSKHKLLKKVGLTVFELSYNISYK